MKRSKRILAPLALAVFLIASMSARSDYRVWFCGFYCADDATCQGPYWPTYACTEGDRPGGHWCMSGYTGGCADPWGGGGGGGECFDDPMCHPLY